jgi:hypothetical protein
VRLHEVKGTLLEHDSSSSLLCRGVSKAVYRQPGVAQLANEWPRTFAATLPLSTSADASP